MIKAKFFAVLMDETTDASRKEQSSITLRYVSNEGVANEKFISFVEAPDVTGERLRKILLTILGTLGRAMTEHPPCKAASTSAK